MKTRETDEDRALRAANEARGDMTVAAMALLAIAGGAFGALVTVLVMRWVL